MPVPAGLRHALMSAVRHVVYLHGFASSPASSKAQRFRRELAPLGVGFSCPDFNEPAFETLTVTRMLDQVARGGRRGRRRPGRARRIEPRADSSPRMPPRATGRAASIGWSCSRRRSSSAAIGFASWASTASRNGARPAGCACFTMRWSGSAMSASRCTRTPRSTTRSRSSLDAAHARLPGPARRVGRSGRASSDGRRAGPGVDLRLLDDGHQLTDSMDEIWKASREFLGHGTRAGVLNHEGPKAP